MIKLTEFTSVVDTYKKNFAIRSKRFDAKKKKDLAEEREEKEKKIEAKKLFKLDSIKDKIGDKAGNILDTVIRFAAFTLIGVLVKNIDKITIALKLIVEKLKEFAQNVKVFFNEKIIPFLTNVFNLGKGIVDVFVGIGDFVIGMNPFKEFDSEFNIIIRGILGLASKLGQLNAPKGEIPGATSPVGSNVKKPTKTPAKTPVRTPVRTPVKTPERSPRVVTKTFSRTPIPVGAGTRTGTGAGTGAGTGKKFFGDLTSRTTPAGGLMDDALKRMIGSSSTAQIGEVAEQFKGLQDPKKLSLYERFLGKGRQVLGSIEKGKDALSDFAKSLQSKVGNSAAALKKIGSTKIPGIGLLDKVPMGARKFLGKSLRLLGLFLLAREVEQDLKNGDVNAAVVKLSAYGLGWLVTASGLLVGSALGVSGVGTVAGVAVLAGSIGAGAGTEALIRKSFLKTESETPPKAKPTAPVVDDSLERLEFPEHFAPKAPEIGNQSSTSKPSTVASVNRNISDGLNEPTTYGSQGIVKTRELFVAIQPIEKQVLVPAA